jgi:TonB family protein
MRWLAAVLSPLVLGCATRAPSSDLARGATPRCVDSPSPDSTVYDTTHITRKPWAISGPQMSYPDQLRQQGINGHVELSVIINADGSVDRRSVTVVWRDRPEFEREALKWVSEARFSPGCIGDNAVRVRIALPIRWTVKS